ncbi:MAG: transposase [Xenococcaceae cyanobacterium MO_234.B1]|nr:transposase [Xenococcaceae cyanobacterium MO_234.B1]
MKLNQHLKDWKQIISYRFPRLSLPQISGLATWSFGMVMTQSSSLTKVSTLIAKVNQEPENTVRQRLKEWYKSGEAKAKKGNKRASMEVTGSFGSILQWIIDLLPQTTRELPIAIDATSIGQNFTVLSVNVLYRRCAIPIAWKVVRGTEKGSWKPYWKQLFQSLKEIVPQDYLVIVSADRGLYASWLYEEIVALSWHPFLRINHQGQYCISDSSSWQPLATLVTPKNKNWSGQITCFKSNPIDCTLLAQWDDDYTDPWLILTDLNPVEADVRWYGFRSWIECSYRDVKSDGWQWHKTRLRQPDRSERHWLAMSVAMLWMLTLGGEQEISDAQPLIDDHSSASFPIPTLTLSCFINGLLTVIAQLLNGQSISFGRLFPLPLNHFSDLHFSNSS